MRKLPSGQETQKLGINVKRTIRAEFYAAAKARNFERMEGRFFEVMFEEWKEFKLQPGAGTLEHPSPFSGFYEGGPVVPKPLPEKAVPKPKRGHQKAG